MLSIASVRSASGAASYFAKDDYYTAEGSAEASAWGGEGAAALGLAGEVDKEPFEALLNGVLPGGEAVAQVENRRAGVDLTFSAPKSVSVMAYVGGDRRILGPDGANMRAVARAMAWAERNLAEGRKDVEGRKVPVATGNLVYALFQHDTSRALDPQAHVHAVIANLTRMPNGKWQALHADKLWSGNSLLGSIYHAFLRDELEKLGYVVKLKGKHGTFEIAGVPKSVLDTFSQRRQDILAKAAELGIKSAQGLRDVTARTRDPKLTIGDREALGASWIEKARSLGYDGAAVRDAAVARAARHDPAGPLERGYRAVAAAVSGAWTRLEASLRPHDPLVDRGLGRITGSPAEARAQFAVASAVRILSEREAAFDVTQVAKAALDLGLTGVTVEHVERRIGQLVDRVQLIAGAPRPNDSRPPMVTTPEALRMEEAILAAVDLGRGAASPILSPIDAADRLRAAATRELNPGQLAAATLILASSDRTIVVQGIAGAGKSTMLQAVARVAETEGRSVIGLAFQNKMVADLAEGAGIPARTIASFILANERHLAEPGGHGHAEASAAFAGAVVIVDETSMVSSRDMLKLQSITAALGVDRLVLVGDRQQLASIDAGKSFALIQAGAPAMARMDENIRQRTDQLRAVAALANIGAAGKALKLLGDGVVEHAEPARHAAERWLALPPGERDNTAVFASGRAARAVINAAIQDGLVAEGAIRGAGIHLTVYERVNLSREELRHASSYHPGQTLEVGRGGGAAIGLAEGRYDVAKVHPNGRVDLSDGRKRFRIDPQRLSPTDTRDRLQLSERKDLHLREGERIRWTANDKPRGLLNAALARVLAVDARGVTVETAGRERLTLDLGDPMLSRLDLAYSLNMHMAQGITTDRAITVMSSTERHLANQRLFNVGVTRVRDALTMVVDDRAKLERQLDANPGDKTSALETVGRLEIDREPHRRDARGPFDPGPMADLPPLPGDLPPLPDGARAPSPGAPPPSDRPPARSDPLPPLPERSLGLDL
ncbi:conjugative relaxase [Sphingomonas sp. MA1305]|jgi:conjugative relaxase-like TrwC/TraI family protein|uniref:MobF family relaxase n=1 Tax=Sphingomonas sp. MA1305 TaxID=2479204 RepID=UPI0018DF513D|nr:MobF family relaxase [Sphingomonas sp. MA1305]MBI0477036.1 conjugative relaxase [Sphingomonas sp. MA1305]